MEGACCLYRYFDIDGVLLYVGIAADVEKRDKAHESKSPWHARVETLKYRSYPSRAEAAAREREAIRTENPLFNVMSNPKMSDLALEQKYGIYGFPACLIRRMIKYRKVTMEIVDGELTIPVEQLKKWENIYREPGTVR